MTLGKGGISATALPFKGRDEGDAKKRIDFPLWFLLLTGRCIVIKIFIIIRMKIRNIDRKEYGNGN